MSRQWTLWLAFFLLCFNYHILRAMKDGILTTQVPSGAALIPWVNVVVLLPCSFVGAWCVACASCYVTLLSIFWSWCGGLLCFFVGFAWWIYPNLEQWYCPVDWMEPLCSGGLHPLMSLVFYWPLVLFYVFSELWASIFLNTLMFLLFHERLSEKALRYQLPWLSYAIVGSATLVSPSMHFLCGSTSQGGGVYADDSTLKWFSTAQSLILGIVCFTFLAVLCVMWGLYGTKEGRFSKKFSEGGIKNGKNTHQSPPSSFIESMRLLFSSKHLLFIGVLVMMSYAVTNLVELLWKDQMRLFFPSPREYVFYQGKLTTWMGFSGLLFAGLSNRLVQRFGWKWVALVTPLVIVITGCSLFLGIFFSWSSLVMWSGSLISSVERAMLYSISRFAKEITYRPLAPHERVQGKSVIDGFLGRAGKVAGSLFCIALWSQSYEATALRLSIAMIFGVMIWFFAILQLAPRMHRFLQKTPKEQHVD